jgi:hypothetical protein
MRELRAKGERLTDADLASFGISPKQPDEPQVMEAQEPESRDGAATALEPIPLFSELEMRDLRSQWSSLQIGFVNEPRRAVKGADKLVAVVMQRLGKAFTDERSSLEQQWDRGDSVSTEDLRVTLRHYRSFFDRLLKL